MPGELELRPEEMKGFYARYGKRILDLLISITSLAIFLPILSFIASSLLLTMGRPVIFRQKRPGLHKHAFYVYKFRTMNESKDNLGVYLKDSHRLTGFGRLLRLGSLDELPELWNVVMGNMSLVGPRPLLMRYLPFFRKEELRRFDARPGITGLAQVKGRNELSWDERCLLDVKYANSISLFQDLEILALTVRHVLYGHGIQVDPEAMMLNLDDERRSVLAGEK